MFRLTANSISKLHPHNATRLFSNKLVPSPSERETIYAVSTPPGKGGIGVVRVSGPDALDVYSGMVRVKRRSAIPGKQRERTPEPWRMHRCSIVHPSNNKVLDEGMAVFFQGKIKDVVSELFIQSKYSTVLVYD
jgi:hypothetical protein